MNGRAQVGSGQETPVYFRAGGEDLFGVFTRPPADRHGTAAVLLSGGGSTAANRNRLAVNIARTLAADGYHALRFDYHGVGESEGVLAGAPKVYEPFLDDIGGALEWLAGVGLDRYVLIGACFGARTALSYAASAPGVEAVVLLSPPLRDLQADEEIGTRLAERLTYKDILRRAFRPAVARGLLQPGRRRIYGQFAKLKAAAVLRGLRRWRPGSRRTGGIEDHWLSEKFVAPLGALAHAGVPVLFVFGTEDWHYQDFQAARPGRLGKVLERAPLTDVVVLDGPVHGFTRIDMQERVAEVVFRWLETQAAERTVSA